MITTTDDGAAYADDSAGFALSVRDTGKRPAEHYGKRQWSWTIQADGTVLATGDDIYGHDGAREALGALVSFLDADAGLYRHHMGPVPDGNDPYSFGDTVAEWAYMVSDELGIARMEISPEESGDA